MGEHAAVYGHPALVAAIDRRLRVSIRPRSDNNVVVDLPTLDGSSNATTWAEIGEQTARARELWSKWSAGDPREPFLPLGPIHEDRLVRLALGETIARLDQPAPSGPSGPSGMSGMDIAIESDLPVGSGFGSSAAIAVGVSAALLQALGELEQSYQLLRAISLDVERRQHGDPSGVDNITVLRGGLLWAQRKNGRLRIEPISSESPLLTQLRVFQSGVPAEPTGVLVSAVRRKLERATARVLEILELIDDRTRELRRILIKGNDDPRRLIDLVRACQGALEELGVVPEPIRRVIRMVEAAGGAAKISGAGALTGHGGGSVLIYHPEPERIDHWRFLRGWSPLPVRLGAEGLRLEPVA